jgi:hypothetical protein
MPTYFRFSSAAALIHFPAMLWKSLSGTHLLALTLQIITPPPPPKKKKKKNPLQIEFQAAI